MKNTPNGIDTPHNVAEPLKTILELKASSVVRSLHLLMYPQKYVPWRLVPDNNYRDFGFREGEWYAGHDILYLYPQKPLSQKAEYIAENISYVRSKTGNTDPRALRDYLLSHSGLPDDWAAKIQYLDENFQVMSAEDILPPQQVWDSMITKHTVNAKPLARWLEGVVGTEFAPIPDHPPDVVIPKEGQIFELLGGVIVQSL